MRYRLFAGLLLCSVAQAAELPWDLSYQTALRDHPIADNEFMRIWPQLHEQRPIHRKLAEYAGEPIEASLLVEQPDGHAGDAVATWIVKTRHSAQACAFHEQRMNEPCTTLDPARAEAMFREVLRMKDVAPPKGEGLVTEKNYFRDGRPLLMNYFGYLSVYVDGKVVQRPIGGDEWKDRLDASRPPGPEAGRLFKVISPVILAAAPAAATVTGATAPAPAPQQDNTELKARTDLMTEVQGYLRAADYKKLEALHARLLASRERTGSGVWKLAIFYNQLKDYPGRSRESAHWAKMFNLHYAWQKQFPKSTTAKMFQAYVEMARGLSYRGNGWFKDVPEDDFAKLRSAVAMSQQLLYYLEKPMLKDKDPEYFRMSMSVDPWNGYFIPTGVRDWLNKGSKLYPDYHEMYFTAALYSHDAWRAAPDAIDAIARMEMGRNGRDSAALYARVYWYANVEVYGDQLFDDNKTLADWDTMKTSFDAMVASYPDPWNLNAYAYFACRARDYPVMTALLERIGQRRVLTSWGRGGAQAYDDCERHKGEARVRPTRDEDRQRQIVHHQRYLNYAMVAREERRYEESLRVLDNAAELATLIYGRPGMATSYHRALALHALKRYDEEVQSLTFGLQTQPGYSEGLYQRGLAYEALGRKTEAREDFEAAALRMSDLQLTNDPEQHKRMEGILRTMTAKLGEYGISVPAR